MVSNIVFGSKRLTNPEAVSSSPSIQAGVDIASLADFDTSDVVDAHLAVIAQQLGTFILTGDPDDMMALSARYESY